MVRKPVEISFASGLEARPLAMLVQIAGRFDSEIFLENGIRKLNAKSIMGMMTLDLEDGDTVVICADGPDEAEAAAALEEYLKKEANF